MLLGAAVFISDALIAYMGWQSLDAWFAGRRARLYAITVLLDITVGVNILGFVYEGWWMLVPSAAGGLVGTVAATRHRFE